MVFVGAAFPFDETSPPPRKGLAILEPTPLRLKPPPLFPEADDDEAMLFVAAAFCASNRSWKTAICASNLWVHRVSLSCIEG